MILTEPTAKVMVVLKDRRKSIKLTQKELAKKAGLTKQYVSLVERGDVRPSLDMIAKIAHPLGLKVCLKEI